MRTINQTLIGITLTWISSHKCRAMTNFINQNGKYLHELPKRLKKKLSCISITSYCAKMYANISITTYLNLLFILNMLVFNEQTVNSHKTEREVSASFRNFHNVSNLLYILLTLLPVPTLSSSNLFSIWHNRIILLTHECLIPLSLGFLISCIMIYTSSYDLEVGQPYHLSFRPGHF